MKPRKPLPRSKTPIRRSPITRGGKPAPRNARRRASEFARAYGSRLRVAWVKSLPCIGCLGFGTAPRENAHTVTGGMGRKAGYETIVPLCRKHHKDYDEHRSVFSFPEMRQSLKDAAEAVQKEWLAHSGGNP